MKGIFGGDVILTLKAPLVNTETGPEITKVFSCLTQLSLKFQLLINIKILIKKGSLTVWAFYTYFSDSQNAAFELLVWCM